MANILNKKTKYANLTFVENVEARTKDKRLQGLFKCDCGREVIKPIGRVITGYYKTCGNKIHSVGINKIHGMRNTKEYSTWVSMKNRVFNKKSKDYPKYSKLGMSEDIKKDFMKFYKEVGKAPSKKHQIDRIDNTKGYFEGNIKWSTRNQQQRNRYRTYILTIKGKKFNTYKEAGKYFGVCLQTVWVWCHGRVDKRNNYLLKPRKDCKYELRYPSV